MKYEEYRVGGYLKRGNECFRVEKVLFRKYADGKTRHVLFLKGTHPHRRTVHKRCKHLGRELSNCIGKDMGLCVKGSTYHCCVIDRVPNAYEPYSRILGLLKVGV